MTGHHAISCARLPSTALPVLAGLRAARDVQAALLGEHAWIRWEPGNDDALHCVLPLAGVQLYVFAEGCWYRFGRRLPAFDFPADLDYRPLSQVLAPAPVQPLSPAAMNLQRLRLVLVEDSRPRPTSMMECGLSVLLDWTETVPEARFARWRACHHQGRVFVQGARLPLLPGGTRYWGESLLIPLGYRPEPDLPDSALRDALNIDAGEIFIWTQTQLEVVAASAFSPVTRAGLRLANLAG